MRTGVRKEKDKEEEGVLTARYKRFGHRFEILIRKANLPIPIEKLKELPAPHLRTPSTPTFDIDSLLAYPHIFTNAVKKEVAKDADWMTAIQQDMLPPATEGGKGGKGGDDEVEEGGKKGKGKKGGGGGGGAAPATVTLQDAVYVILTRGEVLTGHEDREEHAKAEHSTFESIAASIATRAVVPPTPENKRAIHFTAQEIERELKAIKFKVPATTGDEGAILGIKALRDAGVFGPTLVRAMMKLRMDPSHEDDLDKLVFNTPPYTLYTTKHINKDGTVLFIIFDPFIQAQLVKLLQKHSFIVSIAEAEKAMTVHYPSKEIPEDITGQVVEITTAAATAGGKGGKKGKQQQQAEGEGEATPAEAPAPTKKGQKEEKQSAAAKSLEDELKGLKVSDDDDDDRGGRRGGGKKKAAAPQAPAANTAKKAPAVEAKPTGTKPPSKPSHVHDDDDEEETSTMKKPSAGSKKKGGRKGRKDDSDDD